jgi:hypothetical protein
MIGQDSPRRLRILVWNVHGNYLHALTQLPHDWIIPVEGGRNGYTPPTPALDWPDGLHLTAPSALRDEALDLVVYQSRDNLADAAELLTRAQRSLPSIYIEHNTPEPHPTDSWHPFRHPRGLLVHVTHYNAVMWLSPGMPARVIEHGLPDPGPLQTGELPRGITVVNHIERRGRRLGLDLYERARQRLSLDLIGMGSEHLPGGLGEVPGRDVPRLVGRYRYLFSPIRYTSLGLSIVQAMLCGVPVVGFAATELASLISNGEDGFVDTQEQAWLDAALRLERDPVMARTWGANARRKALARFGMARFAADWNAAFNTVLEDTC